MHTDLNAQGKLPLVGAKVIYHHAQGCPNIHRVGDEIYIGPIDGSPVTYQSIGDQALIVCSRSGYSFNCCLADFLLNNQSLIPEKLRGYKLVFMGTIFQDDSFEDGNLFCQALEFIPEGSYWMSILFQGYFRSAHAADY